jgi:rhodanese-related sulfurtransferase
VAWQLQSLGFEAAALQGGFTGWASRYPVEPIAIPASEATSGA